NAVSKNSPCICYYTFEKLLCAYATSYIITIAAMIDHEKLPLKEMSLESEGIVDVTNGVITYKKIIHKPSVTLQENALEEDDRKLRKLIYKAEKSCMISRALRGNVEMELQPNI